jgi:hypothetical protein
LPVNPPLQPFQQRHGPSQGRIWRRLAEYLADHHYDLPGPPAIGGTHFISGVPHGSGGRLPQRTLLITTQHHRCQLLAASIGEQPD